MRVFGDPFEDMNFYRDTFQHAATLAGKALRESALSSPSAQASAIASSARALHPNNWSLLRRAFRSLPSWKPLFAQRGHHIFIVDTAAYAHLAQTVLLRVANGRLSRALAQGDPRPRIASMLAKTKLFLPHRRRDTLGAIILPDGTITSDKERMATALSEIWGRSFAGTLTNVGDMEAFCHNNTTFVDPDLFHRPTIKDVYEAVRRGKNCAPGPDGIRANIWGRFARCVSHAFFLATTYLCNAGVGPDSLSDCLSVYIPKKGLGVGPHGIQAKAGEARPLALKNASAKILWRTLARAVSPALQSWAHCSQRGFVAGRIPGHGVVDIDSEGSKWGW